MDMWMLKEEYLSCRENYTQGKPYQGETRLIHRLFQTVNSSFCGKGLIGYDVVPFVNPVAPVLAAYTAAEVVGSAPRTRKDETFKALNTIYNKKMEEIPANAMKAIGILKSLVSLEIQYELESVVEALAAGTTEILRLAAIINHLKAQYSPSQTDEVNRVKLKLTVVNDYCGIEMFFTVLEDICQLLVFVEGGVHVPTSAQKRDMIPGVCHNPVLVQALEQMRITPAWAGYTYLQAKSVILKMAKRSPDMLKGATKPERSEKKEGVAKAVAGEGSGSGGRGAGGSRYGPGGAGRGAPGGRGGGGGRFGGRFQGRLTPGGGRGSPDTIICYKCGGQGHIAMFCPMKEKSEGQAKQVSKSGGRPGYMECTYCKKVHPGGVAECWKKIADEKKRQGSSKSSKRTGHDEEENGEEDDDRPVTKYRRA